MGVVLHHAALGLAVAALAPAAVRAASPAAPDGLVRIVAAVVLAAACAVVEALTLGLVGLGTTPWALVPAAVATWIAARLWLPEPTVRVTAELRSAWGGMGPAQRAALGAVVGLWAGWAAWLLSEPSIGIDGVAYHLSEVVGWVHGGQPGSVQLVTYEFPVGAYPVTHEVLLSWAMGIARSFVPASLSGPAAAALIGVAGWAGLRALSVPRWLAGLALGSVLTLPFILQELPAPDTDTAALAWLVCAAALCAAAGRRPGLLPIAVVAVGLAVGTKTTAAPLGAIVLAVALWRAHADGNLRSLGRALGVAVLVAIGVGGIWYLRNLFEHGSPLWPFTTMPWGDPIPPYLDRIHVAFIQRPSATLTNRLGLYEGLLAGGVVLLFAPLVAALLDRTRAGLLAAGAAAVGLLAWACAPFTGIVPGALIDFTPVTVRYMLVALAGCAVVLALAGRRGRRAAIVSGAVLGGASAWNVGRAIDHGGVWLPDAVWLAVGAATGLLAAVLASSARAPRVRGVPGRGVAAAAVIAVAAVLAVAADGYLTRHARTHGTLDWPVSQWFAERSSFRTGHETILALPTAMAPLAGDRLQHRVELMPPDLPCRRLVARARRGWVVVGATPVGPEYRELFPTQSRALIHAAGCLRYDRPVFVSLNGWAVFGPGR